MPVQLSLVWRVGWARELREHMLGCEADGRLEDEHALAKAAGAFAQYQCRVGQRLPLSAASSLVHSLRRSE